MSENTHLTLKRKGSSRLASEMGKLRASSLAGAYCELSIRESNSNFESQRFGFRFIDVNAACDVCQRAERFKSSFKMTDSAISFIDLRRCWLSRWIVR